MPSRLGLAMLFLASLLIFSVYLFPASLLLSRLDGVAVAGAPLRLQSITGTLWHGQAQWQWRQLSGGGSWRTDWRGVMPGVELAVSGPLSLQAWVGGTGSSLALEQASLSVSGQTLTLVEPRLRLAGTIDARELSVHFSDKAITEAAGQLAYTGGEASWAGQKSVVVPPLSGRIAPAPEGASLTISDQDGQLMAAGAVRGNLGEFKVFRAWAAEFGMSQGGNMDDVIFETSLPLWQK